MATYFDNGSSEIQTPPDGLHTLHLMNPNYVPNSLFSDTTTTKHQHLLLNTLAGIPVSTTTATGSTNSNNHHSRSFLHDFTAPRGLHYNLWGPVTDQVPTGLAACDRMTTGYDYSGGGGFVSSEIGFLKSSMASPTTQQGLSLTLSSSHDQSHAYNNSADDGHVRVLQGNSPLVQSAIVSKGFCGVQSSVVLGSSYLKAAQELLDDVVHVGKGSNFDSEGTKDKMKVIRESTALIGASSSAAGHHQISSKQGVELSTAQRQELQMKKSKLVTMLDEVEQRYRQYHHQVQYIISSFEQAAGFGSAKSYTALALQTISKQFRCLKDAIAAQIKATSKNLGEEECLGAKTEGSRLSYIHHHVRQQRELQQLRMIQQNAWRPQRGLPERAVSVLRAWLFEHFLHPYPKDSDKVMLAKQTGLTRSQVSNWFINARVRLWKPMVEEMYLEDTKEQEQINGNSENKTEPNKESAGSTTAEIKAIRSNPEKFTNLHQQHHSSPNEILNSRILHSQSGFNLRGSPKKPRSSILSTDERDMKASETSRNGGGYGSGSATCPISEIGRGFSMNHDQQLAPRFHGNGVSLTLGLPHNNNNNNNNVQDQLLGRRLEMETREETSDDFCAINYMQLQPQPAASHSDTGYEDMDMQSRKRFAAQFLPDFVA